MQVKQSLLTAHAICPKTGGVIEAEFSGEYDTVKERFKGLKAGVEPECLHCGVIHAGLSWKGAIATHTREKVGESST